MLVELKFVGIPLMTIITLFSLASNNRTKYQERSNQASLALYLLITSFAFTALPVR